MIRDVCHMSFEEGPVHLWEESQDDRCQDDHPQAGLSSVSEIHEAWGDDRVVIVLTKEMQMRFVALLVVAIVAFLMGMMKGVDMVDQDAQKWADSYCNQRVLLPQYFLNGSINLTDEYGNASQYTGPQDPGWW
jgi:hypothetical protein